MRNRFADTFYELGKNDARLCVIVADISPAGSIEKFRSEFPRRFINTGVSEQIMIGMAAGMAQRGLRPFAYTIATFSLYRPFEMVRDDLCYQNLPVTVVGIGGGVSYSTLHAYDRGRSRLPLEVQLSHWQTLSGSGYVPKQFTTQLQLRYYTRLFGAPLRPPAPGRPPAKN